jgi:hypothetical protein
LNLTNAPASITPKVLTLNGLQTINKVYDGDTTATIVNFGILLGDATSSTDYRYYAADTVKLVLNNPTANFPDPNAGINKPVTVKGLTLSNSNYTLAEPNTTADITPKALRIVANNDARTYDSVAYSGGKGVTYSGFVAGESETVLSGVLVYAGTSQGAVNVGTYTIQPKGLTARNYSLGFEDGQLSIVAATPVVPLIQQLFDKLPPPSPPADPAPPPQPASVPLKEKRTSSPLTIFAIPQENTLGVATLKINQALPAPGQTIQIPMPQELSGASQATVRATGLPPWLSFDPLLQVFILRSVPLGIETFQVIVQVDGKIWNLTLDFRNN